MVLGAEHALPGELRVLKAAERSLNGERRGIRAVLPFLGPAFIAAVAYVDPGNFATNMAGGSRFGYMLLWVVLAANLMAMLIQSMSAKLGIATGLNLPEVCRDRFPRPVVWFLWVQAELIAMATDLAEFVGAALGLNLLFGMPLFIAALLTGFIAFVILGLQASGFRRLEATITRDARHRYGHVIRTRCAPYQRDSTRFSCTAVQFESPLSYTGQVYVAEVFADGRFRYRPYKIPIWLGI